MTASHASAPHVPEPTGPLPAAPSGMTAPSGVTREAGPGGEASPGGVTGEAAPGEGAQDLDALVDRGSWARFTPGLERLVGQVLRGGQDDAVRPTLLLTAPAPAVSASELAAPGLVGRLMGRRALLPSPEAPSVVLTGRREGTEVGVPVLDPQGRALLGDAARSELSLLGWAGGEVMSRLIADDATTAQAVTRLLIETLRVPHPADLDWLLSRPGPHATAP